MTNWNCLLYSSVALFIIVGGQPTTDDRYYNLDDVPYIVAKLEAEQIKSRDENAKLTAKVTHLEAELSAKTSHDCKLRLYRALPILPDLVYCLSCCFGQINDVYVKQLSGVG